MADSTLTKDEFVLVVFDAFQNGVDSSEVVEVMLESYRILCTQEQIEQMYAYFEIALLKPTIH